MSRAIGLSSTCNTSYRENQSFIWTFRSSRTDAYAVRESVSMQTEELVHRVKLATMEYWEVVGKHKQQSPKDQTRCTSSSVCILFSFVLTLFRSFHHSYQKYMICTLSSILSVHR